MLLSWRPLYVYSRLSRMEAFSHFVGSWFMEILSGRLQYGPSCSMRTERRLAESPFFSILLLLGVAGLDFYVVCYKIINPPSAFWLLLSWVEKASLSELHKQGPIYKSLCSDGSTMITCLTKLVLVSNTSRNLCINPCLADASLMIACFDW